MIKEAFPLMCDTLPSPVCFVSILKLLNSSVIGLTNYILNTGLNLTKDTIWGPYWIVHVDVHVCVRACVCVCVCVCVSDFQPQSDIRPNHVSQNVGMNQSDNEELNRCSMTMFFFFKP